MRLKNIRIDEASIVQQFRPLLVLYPEIRKGTQRKVNKEFPEVVPLNFDYHPRDIRMVLDHCSLHGTRIDEEGERERWQTALDVMEKEEYRRDINILDDVSSSDTDEFWRRYGDIRKQDYPRRCYARLVKGTRVRQNRVVVQYWYAYFYNDFWNTHEMDWETVMIVLKLDGKSLRPSVCACSAHHSGFWVSWRDVEKADSLKQRVPDGEHPIVYVAHGSHANYFFGPARYPTAPPAATMAAALVDDRIPIDYVTSFREGSKYLVEAVAIPKPSDGVWGGDWRWLNQSGRWGSPGTWLDFEFGDAGPYGPPKQSTKWETPFRWIDTMCKKAPRLEDVMLPTLLDS